MACNADCRVQKVTANLAGGTYRAFHEDSAGTIWLGGTEGLTRFAEGHFETVDMRSAPRLSSVLAIVDDDFGHLWVGTRLGIVRFLKSEFDRVLQDRTRELRHAYFDRADRIGAASAPTSVRSQSATTGAR